MLWVEFWFFEIFSIEYRLLVFKLCYKIEDFVLSGIA